MTKKKIYNLFNWDAWDSWEVDQKLITGNLVNCHVPVYLLLNLIEYILHYFPYQLSSIHDRFCSLHMYKVIYHLHGLLIGLLSPYDMFGPRLSGPKLFSNL